MKLIGFSDLITRGVRLFNFIREKKMYSILFMRRRAMNQRGTPVRAASQYCLLEEVRLGLNQKYNEGRHQPFTALRDAMRQLIGKKKWN